MKRKIDEGVSLSDLANEHFSAYIRLGRGLRDYKRLRTPKRDFKTTVFLLVGPSETGKSRTAHLLAKMLGSVYFVPSPKGSGLYFDDYDGQTSIILDEFDGNVMTPTAFNSLCDRYPYTLPAHGSAGHQMTSKYIFVCSNYLPKYWWRKRNKEQVKQTERRIEVVLPFLRKDPPQRKRAVVDDRFPADAQPMDALALAAGARSISLSENYLHPIFH